MTFTWECWQITTNKKGYGYVIQRKIMSKKTGKARWKNMFYYDQFGDAATCLFAERVRVETIDCVVDAFDRTSTRLGTALLISKIEHIGTEILEGINGTA